LHDYATFIFFDEVKTVPFQCKIQSIQVSGDYNQNESEQTSLKRRNNTQLEKASNIKNTAAEPAKPVNEK
jgi:hypothetical protein